MRILGVLQKLIGLITDKPREFLLELVLRIIYFAIITPCAFFWRCIPGNSLMRSRGRWSKIVESTETPNIFHRSC
jgi:hypothetical protein